MNELRSTGDTTSDELPSLAAISSTFEPHEEAGLVEFRILGPLEVIGPDGPLELRGAKRRSLVALLLVHAGQWLSTDRIVEALWGDDVAAGATRTVQTYVSQLRQAFDGSNMIPNRDGGYRLDIPLEAFDSWRFEQFVRRASDGSGPDERLAEVNEALALWRGEPLEEFDAPWAVRERTRLQLLHLQARDVQLDARLAQGDGGEVVGELEQLVHDYPLDERFWAKLLVAYYRSGRQSDALHAFQRARSTLAEQLGIDPGPELVQLEQQILQHDERLLGPMATGRSTPTALPTGTVTFLFTDIEDSTRLWEEQPDTMRRVVADHQQLLRETVEAHDGRVVKSIGDGMMAVFADAPNAVAAAIDSQRAISHATWAVPIGVRMGVHTGVAHLIDGDYHAPTVNRAARVAGTAHPGQVLVSAATAALLDDVQLRDVGEHRLKGLAPMRLHQVVADGLRDDFPSTTPSTLVRLPAPATSFVGRVAELDAVAALVREHRLVTLTGVGGCGKTRLAIEVGGRLVDEFADGVRFVDLAAVPDSTGIDDAVIDALGLVADLGNTASRTRLAKHLAERQLLVILDNCEHLLDTCAELVEHVLSTPGPSQLVATSREPIGVVSEHVFVVPSLPVDTDAVRLFLDRAQAARADFAVDEVTEPVVTQICTRLDGVPLAIELAAARTRHLSVEQILDRLDDRFALLTGGHRRIQRQQTLAATLDWSHDLLDPDDQMVLRRLAAFPAAFTLEAAESVTGRPDILDRVASLVDKSLVLIVDDAGERSYRLLESVRLYAEDKLVAAGEAVDARDRHRDEVREWLESTPLDERWLGDDSAIGPRLPSVRAAIEWSMSQGDIDSAAAIVARVDWARTEGWTDGARWCEQLEAQPGLTPERRAPLCLMAWWLDPLRRGRSSWGRVAYGCLEGQESPLRAVALGAWSRDLIVPSLADGDAEMRSESIARAEEAVSLSADGPEPWHRLCRLLAVMAYCSYRDPHRAIEHVEAATEDGPSDGYSRLYLGLLAYMAVARFVVGDATDAAALARQCFNPQFGVAFEHARPVSLVALAADGDVESARRGLQDYAANVRASDFPFGTDSVLILGGVLAALEEDWLVASRLLAAGSEGVFRDPANSLVYYAFRDRAREHLGAERARVCRAEGRAMSSEQALELALQ
jgi:predicted ATPase/class 3 adenylate cyclase